MCRIKSGPSRIDGSGVFAGERIPRRAKIGEVTGEIISLRTARKRALQKCRFCPIDISDTQAIGCTKGNILRLLNHSCQASAFLRSFQERVEVYARRDIRSKEEVTVDYGESPHRGGMKCGCGRRTFRDSI